MANDKYIKVALKGEKPRVILANLRNFYISQGAIITKPTIEEIVEAFPEEAAAHHDLPVRTCDERLKAEIAQWKENAEKQANTIKALKEEKAELKSKVSDLNEQVTSLEQALAETEALVKTLRAEADNNAAEQEKTADEPKEEAKKPSRYSKK